MATPQTAHLVLPVTSAEGAASAVSSGVGIPATLARELWFSSEAESCGLTVEEFAIVLGSVAEKFNCGQLPGKSPNAEERSGFLHSLRLTDLALAAGCALGREIAWQRFVDLFQSPLTQAGIAITGSATLGHDLAESLYAELYGLRTATESGTEVEAIRRSPLSSYSGRGSLLGWLRTTLAQRFVDHHRRTRREAPLDTFDAPAPDQASPPLPTELAKLSRAVGQTLQHLEAQDRFLLSAYFLDHQTLLQIGRTLHVHEATVSRRIKRLTADLRKHLIEELQIGGLSKRGAEEALGTDPRDLEINLRSLLQTSHEPPFSKQMDQPPSDGEAPGQA